MPYSNMPKDKWENMDKCVSDVQGQGHSKDSAIAICHVSLMGGAYTEGRNFDRNVGDKGVDRDKLKNADFVFGDERAFPVTTTGDVGDAVSSWGRYKGKHSFEDFKRNLTALAKRKGFTSALPAEWMQKSKGSILWSTPSLTDVQAIQTVFGSLPAQGELLKFSGAVLARAERNLNGDGVGLDGLHELAATLPLMALDDEHIEDRVIGYFTAAEVQGNALLTDGVLFARRFPDVARDVQSGKKHLSIEAIAELAMCSECKKVFTTPQEYCDHVLNRAYLGSTRWLAKLKALGGGVTAVPAGSDTAFDQNRLTMIASLQPILPDEEGDSEAQAVRGETESVVLDLPSAQPSAIAALAGAAFPELDTEQEDCVPDTQVPMDDTVNSQNPEDMMSEELQRMLDEVKGQLQAKIDELLAKTAESEARATELVAKETELVAKAEELVTAQAKIAELESLAVQASETHAQELAASKLSMTRAVIMLEAGYTRTQVEALAAKLSSTDEAVFNELIATKTAKVAELQTLMASVAGLAPAPEATPDTVKTELEATPPPKNVVIGDVTAPTVVDEWDPWKDMWGKK